MIHQGWFHRAARALAAFAFAISALPSFAAETLNVRLAGRHGSGRSEARHATTTINEGREALLARGFTGIHRL